MVDFNRSDWGQVWLTWMVVEQGQVCFDPTAGCLAFPRPLKSGVAAQTHILTDVGTREPIGSLFCDVTEEQEENRNT